MNTQKQILQVESLTKIYGKGDNRTEALKGIAFNVLEGEFLGIMGASGSGKTTLLNCIATMLKPTSGRIILRGQDISGFHGGKLADYRGREIGYLFQEFELLDNLIARENITLPLSLHGVTAKQANTDISALASILDIVLADEPTGALDSKNSKTLMDKLSAINTEQNKTIMMVTHNANAASYCSHILFIQDGCIFHELRRNRQTESTVAFYERIVTVMAQLGGGCANVL